MDNKGENEIDRRLDALGLHSRRRYTRVRLDEVTNADWPEVLPPLVLFLDEKEPLSIAQSVHPFTEDEVALLTERKVASVEKRFPMVGVQGILRIDLSRVEKMFDPPESGESGEPYFSPYSDGSITTAEMDAYPLLMSMCFNETAKVTPEFEIHFPGILPSPDFISRVVDWDVIEEQYDATQGFYRLGSQSEEMSYMLLLPASAPVLRSMALTPTDRMIHYPAT